LEVQDLPLLLRFNIVKQVLMDKQLELISLMNLLHQKMDNGKIYKTGLLVLSSVEVVLRLNIDNASLALILKENHVQENLFWLNLVMNNPVPHKMGLKKKKKNFL